MNNITELVDQQRWLLNNGLFTQSVQNTLYMYGGIAHPGVTAVELSADPLSKRVDYILYVKPRIFKAYKKYLKYKNSSNIWSLLYTAYLLRRFGNLDLHRMLDSFVKTLCGPAWGATIDLKESSEYVNTGFTTSTGDLGEDSKSDPR